MGYVYLAIAICAEVIGTNALKLSDGFTRPLPSLVTVVGYGVAFYFLALVLKTIPMGVAYAIWSGVGIVLIAAAGWLIQGERLDPPAILGIALIVTGIVVMNVFSKAVAR